MIPWYDNVPLVSYLILGGRCRFCRHKISLRYVLVELITALSFFGLYRYYHLTPLFFAYAFMVSCFIVATFVDFSHRIIPDEVSVGGMVVGIFFSFFIPELHGITQGGFEARELALGRSTLGVIIGGGLIYGMGLIGDVIFRKESMGGGDVKLMAMIGACMGWKLAVLTFFIAPLFGAVYGIIEKIRTKESAIAYGPFLVLGALISLFWGDSILVWFMSGGIYRWQ
jgi:leader peptidase (prepilin peptidase)/N-methyltransferase